LQDFARTGRAGSRSGRPSGAADEIERFESRSEDLRWLHDDEETERTGKLEISGASSFQEFSDIANEKIGSLSLGTHWNNRGRTSGTAVNTEGSCEGVTGSSGDSSVAAADNGIKTSFAEACTMD
jgi:hypothetical protein